MTFNDQITRIYIQKLLATQEGRAHVLNQVAEAEASGEGDIFDRLLSRVDDPDLQRMIRRHQADEVRHARLFYARLEANGLHPGPVPTELKVIDRLSRALGGFMERPIVDRTGVMNAYLVLQVIEERALTQFPLFEAGFRAMGDSDTADVFRAVARDEERHLRYCQAIARRYAPDAATLAGRLAEYRRIEARVFAENSQANMTYCLDHGFVALGPIGRLFFRGLGQVARRLPIERRTPFWDLADRSTAVRRPAAPAERAPQAAA